LLDYRKSGLTAGMRRIWSAVLVMAWALHAHAAPVLHEYFDFTGKQLPMSRVAARAASAERASGSGVENGFAGAVGSADEEQVMPEDPAEANGAVVSGDVPTEGGDTRSQTSATTNKDASGQRSDTGRYRLDGNTSTPSLVGYSDPFSPSIPPYKRLFAYDTVNAHLELVVARDTLTPVGVGGASRASDDQFYAEVKVDAQAEQPLRLPTVGAGFRVLSSKVSTNRSFSLHADSAENLFLRGLPPGPVTWTAHLAIDRRAFGSPFPDVHWSTLRPYVPELPAVVASAAAPVLAKMGVTTSQRPAQALRKLVQYFRSFNPEEKRYTSTGVQLYHDIALSQQGVCRHRSFAFVVTALALGLPSRFVRNEAHAWVEVYDGKLWHRLDLGGAASNVSLSGELNSPHQPPADPYVWPSTGESGQSMVARALGAGGGGSTGQSGARSESHTTSPPPGGAGAPTATSVATPNALPLAADELGGPGDVVPESEQSNESSQGRASTLTVQFGGATLKRGERFSLSGVARQTTGAGCALMRVEIRLVEQTSRVTYAIGTLVTDEKGRYGGELVVPNRVPVGDYGVNVTTPGNHMCAPATAQ
jgi:transglutaminase-like putative cysteine protease